MEIKKNSYTTVRTASKRTFLIIFCVLFVVLCALSCLFISGYFREKYRIKIKENGVTATAEIYAVGYGSGHHTFQCYYQYIDENGIKYWSVWGPEYMSREEAEKNLGKQIIIYIDGKGEGFPVDYEPSTVLTLTFSILMTALTLVDLSGIIVFSIKIKNENKPKKSQKETPINP